MTFPVMLAVLGSALLHALWNSLMKVGTSRLQAMVTLSLGEVLIGLPVALIWGAGFNSAAAPWVIASGVTHFFYKLFLASAYEHGDLSRVYPIARGAAPLMVGLVSAALLSDVIAPMQYAGIAVLGAGILLMAQGVFRSGESRKLLPFALGSACATAAYTLIDGTGARISGNPVAYVAWVFVADGAGFATIMLLWKGSGLLPQDRAMLGRGGLAAAASFGAHAVSVWAMTVAPIALVAALRETSILFAVLIGWTMFGEKMTPGKGLAALVIVSGVMLTRLT
jgi:drug/metabolite transporter (DMT)-like permease